MEDERNNAISQAASQTLLHVISGGPHSDILPTKEALQKTSTSLSEHLPDEGLGLKETTKHLLDDVAPGLNASSLSANYYGFVTGGVTPAARIADNIVSTYDQNVQVHLPDQTVATVVEDRALQMLQELLELDPSVWTGRTFTTGATASNVLGLACGRDAALQSPRVATTAWQEVQIYNEISETGILEACRRRGIQHFQVLTTMAHSSLLKSASIVGLGRANVIDIGQAEDPLKFDFEKLIEKARAHQTASILVVSCGEVNTGQFATESRDEMHQLRYICDKHNIWMHVDAAFGIFARTLEPGVEFDAIKRGCECLELADSITGDAHKLLNVPYDCGFFFCRHPENAAKVFRNTGAAYLSGFETSATIPSPLNIGIENSRRFRALPVYATLRAYGRTGYREMLQEQVRLARAVASYLFDHPDFELLPKSLGTKETAMARIYIIVLFRAKSEQFNRVLVQRINASAKMYVSGTSWDSKPACRIAISNWQANMERDGKIITDILKGIVDQHYGKTLTVSSSA